MHSCGDTSERFPENNMRAAVQDSHNLTVSFNGHARDGAFGGDFEEFYSHLSRQFAAARRKSLLQFGVKVVEYSHSAILPSATLDRLMP
jgi:hypothetical protein